ncbi:MAG TPA: peptide deformylase [Acidimicrobiales bacterium]
MPVRPVLQLPEPVLQRPTTPVDAIDDGVRALLDDLVDTMLASPACVGLAANQIGDGRRACVVDVTGHRKARSCHGLIVLVNPVIVATAGDELAREGCMSVPDLTGDVARATSVVVRGTDREGAEVEIEADAFEARALLHEVDHLDGMVFLDRVESHAAVFRRKVYR